MNKKLLILLSVALVFTLLLAAGCSANQTPATPTTQTPTQATEATQTPTEAPTQAPTQAPTEPTEAPTVKPTQPTEAPQTPTVKPTQPTEKPQTPTVKPTQSTEPTVDTAKAREFADYLAMTGQEQEAFADSFDSLSAFVQWYNAARDAYRALNPDIELDGQPEFGG